MEHTENTRVKIPALVHLTRLGYKYLSLKEIKQYIHENTNIFRNVFCESINKINKKNFSIEKIEFIMKNREKNYKKAHFTINTTAKTPQVIVEEILGVIND